MGFVFQVKECSLGIKSMYTVNVYTLIFIYIFIQGAEVMGILSGNFPSSLLTHLHFFPWSQSPGPSGLSTSL